MVSKLLLAAFVTTALLVVPTAAEAASAGFCVFGMCQGVNTRDLPLPPELNPPPAVGCTNVSPATIGQPDDQLGGLVVQVCV